MFVKECVHGSSAVVELETDNFSGPCTNGQFSAFKIKVTSSVQQTHESSACNNPGSARCSGHIDDSMTAVENQRWTHR